MSARPPIRPSAWPPVTVTLPDWADALFPQDAAYPAEADRVRVAIDLARHNVERGTGGPFGAAIFERASGRLVGIGVNAVVRSNNATAHAEMVAIAVAQARRRSWTLSGPPDHELVTSCDPCAMCLGGILWSGVSRLVAAADRADATALGFDEGPVFPDSFAYLERRGITIARGVLRDEGRAVLERYRALGGPIYNA